MGFPALGRLALRKFIFSPLSVRIAASYRLIDEGCQNFSPDVNKPTIMENQENDTNGGVSAKNFYEGTAGVLEKFLDHRPGILSGFNGGEIGARGHGDTTLVFSIIES